MARPPTRTRPPLDQRSLRDLGLRYVARYATTRAKLIRYLTRKLAERGWAASPPPDPAGLAEDFARSGYIDDAAFATARSEALQRRGFGGRRIGAALDDAGIDCDLRRDTVARVAGGARAAAIALARRRRLGPFGPPPADRRARDRQLAVLLRAGHALDDARRVIDAETVELLDNDEG